MSVPEQRNDSQRLGLYLKHQQKVPHQQNHDGSVADITELKIMPIGSKSHYKDICMGFVSNPHSVLTKEV